MEEEISPNVVRELNLKLHTIQSDLDYTLPNLNPLSIGAQIKAPPPQKKRIWGGLLILEFWGETLGLFGVYISDISHRKQAYYFTPCHMLMPYMSSLSKPHS